MPSDAHELVHPPIPRVLLIDDDAALGPCLCRVLSSFVVFHETDPARALARVRRERFDVILCDLEMPTIAGEAVREMIDAHFRGRRDAPVVVMISGHDRVLELALFAAVDVMLKPLRPAEVRGVVTTAMARRGMAAPRPISR